MNCESYTASPSHRVHRSDELVKGLWSKTKAFTHGPPIPYQAPSGRSKAYDPQGLVGRDWDGGSWVEAQK